MINTILKEINEYADEIKALRRRIHRHPELGNNEWQTAALIENYLQSCDIEVRRVLDTAVIGVLQGELPGRTVALRADMDALPMKECSGVEFASEIEGVMHGCGHDVHTSALLGTARILSLHKSELRGSVVFIFQPDEEGNGGAKRLIAEGCLEGVDAVFGAHVSPELDEGHIGIRYGKFYAASDMFTVSVHGKSAHGAEPEKGIDAIYAAAQMINELKALPSQLTSDKCVLTVGKFIGGTAGNIIADEAEFTGIIRTLGQETRSAMKEAFIARVNEIAEVNGCAVTVNYRSSYPGIVNDDEKCEFVRTLANSVIGEDKVSIIGTPTMMTEDFGYYLMEASGCFFHIGAGCKLPLHNPGFVPTEQTVLDLALIFINVIMNFSNC